MRTLRLFGLCGIVCISLLVLSSSAFADTIDPVGFCPPPATVTACTTATGLGNETIGVNGTDIGMYKNGNGGTPSNPWELIVAIPNYSAAAPTITFTNTFTVGTGTSVGDYTTSSPDLYTFAGTTGDSSMNQSNMFGANEQAAFGGTPSFFDVFVYSITPGITSNTPYEINVGGSGLPNGTFLAAAGGSNPFTTPFTVTGLVSGPGDVPEPSSLILLGSGIIGLAAWSRKRATK